MFKSKPRRTSRNSRGSVASVIMIGLLLVMFVAASLSFDYAHGLLVREQLQNACDAGALAGALELAKPTLTAGDTANAEKYAYDVSEKNTADNIPVSIKSPDTLVTVTMNSTTIPRTVTVTATRTTANIFARLIGFNTMPISATATAQAYKGIKQVKPGQLLPLAVSLDTIPSKGPQEGIALNTLTGPNTKQRFNLVLNPQNSKNASWLKNWNPNQNPTLTFGVDSLNLNGVDNNMSMQYLKPDTTIYIPLITGDPPFNQSRTIVGVIGFYITKTNLPLSIEGYIKDPQIVKGTPGVPVLDALGLESVSFLDQNAPWQVQLIN
jgi:Flp pilus assembly protein TadG